MAFLGSFREAIEKIRLHLKADKTLLPSSVYMVVSIPGEPLIPLDVVPDESDPTPGNEWKNTPDFVTQDLPLGIAALQYGASDLAGRSTHMVDTFRIGSTYGRNYGEDYGDGL